MLIQASGFKTFYPSGPQIARPRMHHTDYLLGDGAGSAPRSQCTDVQNQSCATRRPVDPMMLVEMLVLGDHDGSLQERRNAGQRQDVRGIPTVLQRVAQRRAVASQYLGFDR